MGAKFKCKTHLLNTFFILAPFLRVRLQSLKKYYYDIKNWEKIKKKISKNAEFHADFKSVEKVYKNAPKKL
jgi:hypothetical protein